MLRKSLLFCFLLLFALASFIILSPNQAHTAPKYDKSEEPNIDLFMMNWKDAKPHTLYGSLEVRDLLTGLQGDPLKPKIKGAVLTDIHSISYGTLKPGASTTPSKLYRVQGIFYIASGKGNIKSGGAESPLYEGIGVLVPPGVEFTLMNTGKAPLILYIIEEPIPRGFTPGKKMVVKNDRDFPPSTNLHRADSSQWLFSMRDGLSTIVAFDQVIYEPKSMVPPHVHLPGEEEVWVAIDDIDIQVGNEHRTLRPGTAYKVPANGSTAHANINTSKDPKRLLWMMKVPVIRVNPPIPKKPVDSPEGLI
jgi:mannose-6-phosphate isomerase-like protein (cupin superfamily)